MHLGHVVVVAGRSRAGWKGKWAKVRRGGGGGGKELVGWVDGRAVLGYRFMRNSHGVHIMRNSHFFVT